MKSFVEYLLESNQPYEFRFKIAGELSDDCISRIESKLDKHGLESMSKPKRTPIQEQPAGFAQDIKNTEVNIIDVSTNYPTTPHQLLAMLTDTCGLPESHIVVINKNDPEEVAREAASTSWNYDSQRGRRGSNFYAAANRDTRLAPVKVKIN